MTNFIILIILHLIGDFYLQTSKIAKCKSANLDSYCSECTKCKSDSKFNIKYLLLHSLIYAIPFISVFFLTDLKNAICLFGIIVLTHFAIDLVFCCINKKVKHTFSFLLDQSIHIMVLYFCSHFFIFNEFPEKILSLAYIALCALLLIVPISVLIDKLFIDLFDEHKNTEIFDVGSVIGILERFIIVVLAYFNSFAAIAIIITIKTWARSEDLKGKDFRNKYLLGTLASLTSALLVFLLYKILL